MTAATVVEERDHAILSASGAHRWLVCTPSARVEQQFPDESGEYAEEGTVAHALAEVRLRQALGERVRLPNGFRDSKHYSESMESYIEEYVSLVIERINEHRATGSEPVVLFEQRLDFSKWVPEGFGTGDVVIISDLGIEVIDLKYGRGVPVSAIGNEQLRLYGLGAYDRYSILYDLPNVIMTIVQPRLDSITTDVMTTEELLAWAEETVRPKADLAWEGKGEFVAGEHCRFCRARHTCRARAEANLALAAEEFAFEDPSVLSLEEIGVVLDRAEELNRWVKDVTKYAQTQAEKYGVKIPGWKLVEGRSNRKYTDESAVAKKLVEAGYSEEEIHEKVLLGISKMEKLLGKSKFMELLADLVIKPAGRPTLVPESDKRPEINSTASAQADFGKGEEFCKNCLNAVPCPIHD